MKVLIFMWDKIQAICPLRAKSMGPKFALPQGDYSQLFGWLEPLIKRWGLKLAVFCHRI